MNISLLMPATLVVYFLVLLLVSRRTARCGDNDVFFRGGHASPWWLVGFGMIGASISGVSFISVPGWVASTGMTYLQMCAGFFFGYVAVAFVLLPLYYRLRLTSIYDYLESRFDRRTHRTGALFFFLSKLTGAAARLYLVCLVVQHTLFADSRMQKWLPGASADGTGTLLAIAAAVLLLIWAYTRRGGIFTLVRTDALQTLCLLLALGTMLAMAASRLGLDAWGVVRTVCDSPMSEVVCLDAASRQYFWRQFLSGIFIVVVMTGLDQDMMQKNLTCRNLHEARRNMLAYGACFLPVNFLLLTLGVLLYALCAAQGIAAPADGDALLPMLVERGALGLFVTIPFTIGIVAAAFSSADSAITALTTTVCIDLLGIERRAGLTPRRAVGIRRRVHAAVAVAFLVCILLFRLLNDTNVIDAIYVMASYTYGPLLGLYAFGLFTRRRLAGRCVPFVAVAAPVVCGALDRFAPLWWGYTFGYELLMLNGLLTFGGLWLFSSPADGRPTTGQTVAARAEAS